MDDLYPSLLVLVVDVDFESWKSRETFCMETQVRYNEMIASLIIFCNSYVLMHRQNRLCVIASHVGGCTQIYPRKGASSSGPGIDVADDFVPLGHNLASILSEGFLSPFFLSGITPSTTATGNATGNATGTATGTATVGTGIGTGMMCMGTTSSSSSSSSSSISKAYSKALCTIHRQLQQYPTNNLQPRVLVIQITSDDASKYNSIMNSIFSADQVQCPYDAVILNTHGDSHFLQQACYITGGSYIRPLDQKNELLQCLLTHCLPSTHSRKILQSPIQKQVDFRATCVCHKTHVEFAYMCSVCLALFCQTPTDGICWVCGTSTVSSTSASASASSSSSSNDGKSTGTSTCMIVET